MKRADTTEEKDFGVIFDIISRRRALALMQNDALEVGR